jgi:hypothetical protein
MHHITEYNLECAILRTFIQAEDNLLVDQDHRDIEYFNIDSKYFENEFNKMICDKIMENIKKGESLSLLSIKIEAWIRDKKPEYIQYWLNVFTPTPIPMSAAEQYYRDIKTNYIRKKANARPRSN